MNHLNLGEGLVQLLVVTITAKNDNLEMLRQVAEAIDRADSDPHVIYGLLGLLVVVVSRSVCLLLKVLA